MKNIFYIVICFLAILTLGDSCKKDTTALTFSVDNAEIDAPANGTITGFVIHTMETWTVTKPADADWITFISQSSGKFSQKVVIKVEENMTTNTKTATLLVAADGQTKNVVVNQAANVLPAAAGTIEGNEVNSCPDEFIVLSVAPIEHAAAYVWYKDDVELETTTDPSYTVYTFGTGTYTVAGKNAIGLGAVSVPKSVTNAACPLEFGIGQTYSILTVNKSVLNTAGGNSMVDPFLTDVHDATYNSVASIPRLIDYFMITFGLDASSNPQMTLTVHYTNAGSGNYFAYAYYKLNMDVDGNVYFTDMQPTAGNMNTVGPRMATNLLSFFLYEGTGNANGTTVSASGNKFKIDWAPNNTPGLSGKLGGFYVVGNEALYMPGTLGN